MLQYCSGYIVFVLDSALTYEDMTRSKIYEPSEAHSDDDARPWTNKVKWLSLLDMTGPMARIIGSTLASDSERNELKSHHLHSAGPRMDMGAPELRHCMNIGTRILLKMAYNAGEKKA
ncbi:hypothetical protein BGX31_007585 [Mortierella sp. GBA43]|nr:hypothetical protein BGX31_007585 [Mortierella sp. GBA43]